MELNIIVWCNNFPRTANVQQIIMIDENQNYTSMQMIFQPQQNENHRSPSPVVANPLFKKCSVADMSPNLPGVSLIFRSRQALITLGFDQDTSLQFFSM